MSQGGNCWEKNCPNANFERKNSSVPLWNVLPLQSAQTGTRNWLINRGGRTWAEIRNIVRFFQLPMIISCLCFICTFNENKKMHCLRKFPTAPLRNGLSIGTCQKAGTILKPLQTWFEHIRTVAKTGAYPVAWGKHTQPSFAHVAGGSFPSWNETARLRIVTPQSPHFCDTFSPIRNPKHLFLSPCVRSLHSSKPASALCTLPFFSERNGFPPFPDASSSFWPCEPSTHPCLSDFSRKPVEMIATVSIQNTWSLLICSVACLYG